MIIHTKTSRAVFYNTAGNKIDAGKLKREFIKSVKEGGIQNFRFHDFRHTFATRLIQNGVDIYTVSKLLGHKDISTTAKYYAHHYTESLRRGINVLDTGYSMVTVEGLSGNVSLNANC